MKTIVLPMNQICFDNEFSSLTSKLVYFEIAFGKTDMGESRLDYDEVREKIVTALSAVYIYYSYSKKNSNSSVVIYLMNGKSIFYH